MDNDEIVFTDEQLSAFDVAVEKFNRNDDVFEGLSDEQFAALDKDIENYGRTSGEANQQRNQPTIEKNASIVTVSQLELAAAVFDDDDNHEPSLEHLECLRSRFGHNQFREKQWDIINIVMNEKRDALAVMATGYGKSLCFQFPAVYKNGMVLVISPLISLMQAQVIALNDAKIPACLVGSAQEDKNILTHIKAGKFKVIYSSPEFIQSYCGTSMLNVLKNRLTLIAIDESHCVSAWGLDFRPDFRRLNIIRTIIPNTPILALTATATELVRHDIKSSLGLIDPEEILTSFDRPNLEFIVYEKTSVWRDLSQWVTNVTGSVIIYVLKRVEAEEIAEKLRRHLIPCQPYHAGMEPNQRKLVLKAFLDDDLKVIVATTAFGMGIDKKNIRTVIHYGSSKNLESYYQEVGRAGRDGLPSKVVTYFELEDFDLHDWFLEKENEKDKLSCFVKKFLRNLALHIREFLHSTECRRKIILRYFGESTSDMEVRNNCCDNCAKGLSQFQLSDLYFGIDEQNCFDFAKDAEIFLNAIRNMEIRRISPEPLSITKLLKGVSNRSLTNIPEYGKGIGRKPYYWSALLDQLMSAEYIDLVAGKTSMTVSQKGLNWCKLSHPKTLKLKPVGAMYRFLTEKPSTPLAKIQWTRGYNEFERIRGVQYGSYTNFWEMFWSNELV